MNRRILLKAYRKALREMAYPRVAVLRATNDQRAFCPRCAGLDPPVVNAMSCYVRDEGFAFVCAACDTHVNVPRPIHNWSLEGRRQTPAGPEPSGAL